MYTVFGLIDSDTLDTRRQDIATLLAPIPERLHQGCFWHYAIYEHLSKYSNPAINLAFLKIYQALIDGQPEQLDRADPLIDYLYYQRFLAQVERSAKADCYGCIIDHPQQDQHSCLGF